MEPLIDIISLRRVQQVEIQIRGEARQVMEQHERCATFESKKPAQFLIAEDSKQYLYQIIPMFIDVH